MPGLVFQQPGRRSRVGPEQDHVADGEGAAVGKGPPVAEGKDQAVRAILDPATRGQGQHQSEGRGQVRGVPQLAEPQAEGHGPILPGQAEASSVCRALPPAIRLAKAFRRVRVATPKVKTVELRFLHSQPQNMKVVAHHDGNPPVGPQRAGDLPGRRDRGARRRRAGPGGLCRRRRPR
ncbi:hypothetical protein CITRIK5_50021 [Citricoccus sp. K5]|nr:hypothetical protein CITRIK5_50021 [Citricoccus sp. K5]